MQITVNVVCVENADEKEQLNHLSKYREKIIGDVSMGLLSKTLYTVGKVSAKCWRQGMWCFISINLFCLILIC